jgi:hypothetical protein
MKATELRIGNLLADIFGDHLTVTELRKDRIVFNESGKDNHGYCTYDAAKPIPLTEEWLLKFGFVKSYDLELPLQNAYRKNDLLLSEDYTMSYCDQFMQTFGKPVKYIHSIQNLYFALTGEELQINED